MGGKLSTLLETNSCHQGNVFDKMSIGKYSDHFIAKWSVLAQEQLKNDLRADLPERERDVLFEDGAIDSVLQAESEGFSLAKKQSEELNDLPPTINIIGRNLRSGKDVWKVETKCFDLCAHSEYVRAFMARSRRSHEASNEKCLVLDAQKFTEVTIKALIDGYEKHDIFQSMAVATYKKTCFVMYAGQFSEATINMLMDGYRQKQLPSSINRSTYEQKIDFLFRLFDAAMLLGMGAVRMLIGREIILAMDHLVYGTVFDFANSQNDEDLIQAWAHKVGTDVQNLTLETLAGFGPKHLQVLLQSETLNLPEEDVLNLLLIWGNACKAATDEEVQSLMKYVRTPFIDTECPLMVDAARRGFLSTDHINVIRAFQEDHLNQHVLLGNSTQYQIRKNAWNRENVLPGKRGIKGYKVPQ